MDIVIYKCFLSLLLGAFIGIERQMHESKEREKNYLGLRTFALITSFGTVSGFLGNSFPFFFLLLSGGIILLIIAYYIFDSIQTKDYGFTTEITLIFSYLIGVIISGNIFSLQFVIGMTVVLVFLLSQKERLRSYLQVIKREELQSFIRYAFIALVILPLLPNTTYHLNDVPYAKELIQVVKLPVVSALSTELINPFQVWLIVALITGIDVLGYILERFFGNKKGWFITSFVGGFISSTATTHSLAQQSKTNPAVNMFVIAAVTATFASFFEHALLILPLNMTLFIGILPILAVMILVSGVLIYFFNRKNSSKKKISDVQMPRKKELFHLYPAIKFAVLFVIIKFASELALRLFGSSGFLIAIGVGAIPGMDASLITIAQVAGKTLSLQSSLIAFLIANTVNLFVKCLLTFYEGKREFALKFSLSIGVILFAGFIEVLLQEAFL